VVTDALVLLTSVVIEPPDSPSALKVALPDMPHLRLSGERLPVPAIQ
jgi:hypothetical protein